MTFVNSTKLPVRVLAWENFQEFFVMLVVVVVVLLNGGFHISGLLFLATATPPWFLKPVQVSTSSELYLGYFRLFYFCQAFSSQFYRECYGFGWALLIRRRFLPYALSPTFLARFVTQVRAGASPPRIILCDCPHRVAPSG